MNTLCLGISHLLANRKSKNKRGTAFYDIPA